MMVYCLQKGTMKNSRSRKLQLTIVFNGKTGHVTCMDTGGVSISQPQNIARRTAMGLNMNVNSKPNKNRNLNGGFDMRHMEIVAPTQKNKGWMRNVNMNTTYKLPKDITLQAYSGIHSSWLTYSAQLPALVTGTASGKESFLGTERHLYTGDE